MSTDVLGKYCDSCKEEFNESRNTIELIQSNRLNFNL